MTSTNPNLDELWIALRDRLAEPGYPGASANESAFEAEVWTRVVRLAKQFGLDVTKACVTSHVERVDRSTVAWKEFCREDKGPDVNVLGSNNRLDIVLRHPQYGSIGIELKCLGANGHAGKLTQGLGQAVLGLTHRDRTILASHSGTVEAGDREQLRTIVKKICQGMRTAVVVVPLGRVRHTRQAK